jgi:hypothetical protein
MSSNLDDFFEDDFFKNEALDKESMAIINKFIILAKEKPKAQIIIIIAKAILENHQS